MYIIKIYMFIMTKAHFYIVIICIFQTCLSIAMEKQNYRNIQVNDINDSIIEIPINKGSIVSIPYEPMQYSYAEYIVNKKPYLDDMDPKQLEKYGVTFTKNEQDRSSTITIQDTEFNQFNTLNINKQEQFIFGEIIKYYCFKSPENLPSLNLKIKSEESKKLLSEEITKTEINFLFQADTKLTEFQFKNMCQKITTSLIAKMINKNDIKDIQEYA